MATFSRVWWCRNCKLHHHKAALCPHETQAAGSPRPSSTRPPEHASCPGQPGCMSAGSHTCRSPPPLSLYSLHCKSSGWALEGLTHHLTRPGPDVDVGIVSFVTKLSGNFEGVFQTCGPFMRHIMLEPRMWKIRGTDFPGFCGQILSGEFFFVYRAKFGAFHSDSSFCSLLFHCRP